MKTLWDVAREVMWDGGWFTVGQLTDAMNKRLPKDQQVRDDTASARMRDLRKPQYGGFETRKEWVKEYRCFRFQLVRQEDLFGDLYT